MKNTEQLEAGSTPSTPDESITTAEGKKHFGRNTVSSLVFFAFSAATSLLIVPYVIRHLGIANYGMITLANSFIQITQVLTIAIVGTVTRFVIVHSARGDDEAARGYFSTQFTALLVLSALIVPLAISIALVAPAFINIPPGQKTNTQTLIVLCYAAFALNLFISPLQVAQYIKQRFDIRNTIEIMNQAARYGTWILMFGAAGPALWQIGLGYVMGSALAVTCTWFVLLKLTPKLKPQIGHFDKSKFTEMVSMGAWVTVNQVGTMLYLSVDSLIINKTLGPASAGCYGTVMGLFLMLRVLSGLMSGMMMPLALSFYARNDWPGLIRTSAKAVRFMSLGMALPLGVACGFAVPFVEWWLGPKPEYAGLWLLIWLLLAPQVWNSAMEPLFGISTAANKVVIPGVAAIAGGVVKLVLAIVFVKYAAMGIAGVALANLISFSLKNVVFTPLYSGHILRSSSKPFYKAIAPSTLVFGAVALTSWYLTQLCSLTSFPAILAAGALLIFVFALLVYQLVLNNDDRLFLAQVAPWAKKKGVVDQ